MDKKTFDKISSRIDGYGDEAIKLETELTAIQALAPENGGDGEQEKAAFLQTYLEKELHCDQVTRYDAPDERVSAGVRPNLIATIKGNQPGRTVWIMSHMDVVPPGDLSKWEGDPWTVRVADGKIYGRGTEDNQQGIVSSLLTAKAFRDENIVPESNIGLILVADEETGSKYGIQYLLEQHKALFKKDDLYIIPDAGNSEGSMLEIAEKSILWFKFRVLGKQTHASTPELGVNAFKAGAYLIVKLDNLYMMYNAADPVFDPPLSTFEPTKKEANVPNINTIPGEDVFYLDCRLLPSYDVDQFITNVKRICKEVESRHHVTVEVTTEQELRAPASTPAGSPVVKALQLAISETRGLQAKPMGIGGGTVAAFFRQAGIPAVVWATQDDTLHGPNEYAKIENILNDAKVFAHVALQK